MEETSKDSIGKIIKQQRILLGLSQGGLAEKAGVHQTLIGRLEKGQRFPSARTLRKLAKVLGIGEVELFIHADYIAKSASYKKTEEDTQIMKLDPKVIFELSKETLKTQRALLVILKMLKSLAAEIALENDKDN